MKALQVHSKIWLEVEGEPLLGDGRERLLRLIDELGSINAAAREMGLTYRRAWSYLQAMELKLEEPLILREKGGRGGGCSHLTPAAKQLLERYARLRAGLNEIIDRKFVEIFGPQEY
jgi:molybdate transport system regulatory protein